MTDEMRNGAEFEAKVRALAYDLWDQDGRQQGRDEEYWHRAVGQLSAGTDGVDASADAHHTGQIDDDQDDLGNSAT